MPIILFNISFTLTEEYDEKTFHCFQIFTFVT